MKDLLLFPFGGNAREALDTIRAVNRLKRTWNVIGFVDDGRELWGREFCGVKVIGGREALDRFPAACVLAAPGRPETYHLRNTIIDGLGVARERYATIVDPSARVAMNAVIGKNVLVMANVVISCSVHIGDHCVILPNTVISHDSSVGDYSMIGSNVSVSGACKIGRLSYLGSGSRLKDGVAIGEGSLIGIGSCVIDDVAGGVVAAGNPARELRKTGEKIEEKIE